MGERRRFGDRPKGALFPGPEWATAIEIFDFMNSKIGLPIDGRDAQNATETSRNEDCHTGNGTRGRTRKRGFEENSIGNRLLSATVLADRFAYRVRKM